MHKRTVGILATSAALCALCLVTDATAVSAAGRPGGGHPAGVHVGGGFHGFGGGHGFGGFHAGALHLGGGHSFAHALGGRSFAGHSFAPAMGHRRFGRFTGHGLAAHNAIHNAGRLGAINHALNGTRTLGGARPKLADFYASLNDEQKARFNTMGPPQNTAEQPEHQSSD